MFYLQTRIGKDADRFEYQPIIGTIARVDLERADAKATNRKLGWVKYSIIESDKFPEGPASE